jgi:hypothetical protein
MKYLLILLLLSGCSTYEPIQRIPFKDQILFNRDHTICSATDGVKTIAWSCPAKYPIKEMK